MLMNIKEMTRCKYHHNDIVSFCLNVGCLLPLCSHCIPQHQAYHFQTGTQMCIVKLQQSIEAAQTELSSILVPLARLRASFHQIRARKLELFYEKIQKEKSILLSRVQQEFNTMASHYVEFIQQNLISTRQKLESTIGQIERNSVGLMSGTKTIETLVQFWINRRSITQKAKIIQKQINHQVTNSNSSSLDNSMIKNVQFQAQKIITSTKALFNDVPTATIVTQLSPLYQYQQINIQQEQKGVTDRISILQEQNKKLLSELNRNRTNFNNY